MSNMDDMSSEPTVQFPRVDPSQIPSQDPGPTPSSARRGPVLIAGASAAALIVGALGGYVYGSSGTQDTQADAPAVTTTMPSPAPTAAPVLSPGQFMSTIGTVESIEGNTFVLATPDNTRATVITKDNTRVITLRGNTLSQLHVGDSAVVQGAQSGTRLDAELVIAGALPGLIPTTAARPEPSALAEAEPEAPEPVAATTRWTPPPAVAPVAPPPPAAPLPTTTPPPPVKTEIGPKRDDYGPKQDSYGPKQDNYGPKQDNYGPKQDSYGPKQDSYGPN